MEERIEKKVDSLLFVLANKPWSAVFLLVLAAAVFILGIVVGKA